MKSNRFFMVVLFSIILLASCANKTSSLEEEIVENLAPTLTLQTTTNGVESSFERKAHKWEEQLNSEENRVTFIDYAPPTILVRANQKIRLFYENDPKLSVYLIEKDERVEEISLEKNEFVVPEQTGHYIYEVVAEYPNGVATYSLNVDVQ